MNSILRAFFFAAIAFQRAGMRPAESYVAAVKAMNDATNVPRRAE